MLPLVGQRRRGQEWNERSRVHKMKAGLNGRVRGACHWEMDVSGGCLLADRDRE